MTSEIDDGSHSVQSQRMEDSNWKTSSLPILSTKPEIATTTQLVILYFLINKGKMNNQMNKQTLNICSGRREEDVRALCLEEEDVRTLFLEETAWRSLKPCGRLEPVCPSDLEIQGGRVKCRKSYGRLVVKARLKKAWTVSRGWSWNYPVGVWQRITDPNIHRGKTSTPTFSSPNQIRRTSVNIPTVRAVKNSK